jgi:hypothetical protein
MYAVYCISGLEFACEGGRERQVAAGVAPASSLEFDLLFAAT